MMKNSRVRLCISLVFAIILYIVLQELVLSFLNSYFPARRDIAFGIAVYYNKFVFSIVLVLSAFIWLIVGNKAIRMLFLSLIFLIYFIFWWYPSISVYPYRISLLLGCSMFFYVGFHLYIWYSLKNEK